MLLLRLYLIEILHQTTTVSLRKERARSCILSKFYIKPQQTRFAKDELDSCILSKFYIKPQQRTCPHTRSDRCILSKFYIKPQLSTETKCFCLGCILSKFYIKPQLAAQHFCAPPCCILSKFYIKPQLVASCTLLRPVVSYRNSTSNHNSAALLFEILTLYLIEILHQTTTLRSTRGANAQLYLIEILHQTTTSGLILIDKVLLTGCLPL